LADILNVTQGEFLLSRFPKRKNETLRAWDAADEYVLDYLAEQNIVDDSRSLLIINDSFGALSVSLSEYKPLMQSDSYLAHQGVLANLADNNLPGDYVTLAGSLEPLLGKFDVVIIKIPKSLALLEDQLIRLQPHLNVDSIVIGAGMVKGIHTSTLKLFEKIIGSTRTSLARKKARLIFSELDTSLHVGQNPYPKSYLLEGTDYQVFNHSSVFSQQSLDIGTRFFLEHIPEIEGEKTIVDLGCGNGVVGLIAADRSPDCELVFIDESYMAVASAEQNFRAAFGDRRKARFDIMDCFGGNGKNSADIIFNNPPFHQHNAVGDFIARQMFNESKMALKNGGELWVIGNRHLGYHSILKKLFGNCTEIASNKKFMILKSIKSNSHKQASN